MDVLELLRDRATPLQASQSIELQQCRSTHEEDLTGMQTHSLALNQTLHLCRSSYEQDTTVVPRWSAVLHAKLQYREGGGLRAVNVRLAANALQLCFTPQAMRTWLSLRANAMHYLQHRNYRRRRPQVHSRRLL